MQSLALYATLGLLLVAVGWTITEWQFWAFTALFWASGLVSRQQGFELGLTQGMDIYRQMTIEQRAKIDSILKDEEQ